MTRTSAQPRPRAELDALHAQLVAIRDRPPSPRQPPPMLKPLTDNEDFHSLVSYIHTFT